MESRLTILERVGIDKHGHTAVRVRCICGTERVLPETVVRTGRTKSCGCLKDEVQRARWARGREDRFWVQVDKRSKKECWRWLGFSSQGPNNSSPYGVASYEGKQWRTHRLAYRLVKGEIPEGAMVLHTCDNTLCCNPNHLYLGDHKQNMRDVAERGLRKNINTGEQNGRAKLTQEQADEIRALYATSSRSQQSIADEYGVSQFAVSQIVRNKRYCT
ncbi:HNH endonuclease [Azohydromonas aeria]|uniref:HNH endonuclease n=1 Tax=Azohydromonas aeria TaxID=2590212 RepID=UPI0012F8F850|nr:HNH endonuclease [Azohydromonas aeria]